MQNKLLNSSEEVGNLVIYEVLTEYYRTRMDEVDIIVDKAMQKMMQGAVLTELIKIFTSSKKDINSFELMEAVSRYQSTREYVEIGSLIINYLFGEKILIAENIDIIKNEYTNQNLNEIKDELVYLKYFAKQLKEEEEEEEVFLNEKNQILKISK